ncbi:amidohydrolase family protein [Planosporangium thailandense]|uniref:Amidohydrolase family protein n=1 Tax=Planosporangium thailandense TaxID=765197 RepID=A0ABX0Y6N5_9ACTN|nr:amidohydrolase [Planosporangium thailandense]NJC74070.1 amidohydrolase family protein [Planosporangium thailandense]
MTEPVIFTGGPIRLMAGADPAAEAPPALLVQDGRVRAVGSVSDMHARAEGLAREVDLDGRTLLPGFVDAHAHTVLHGSGLDWVDLSDAKTIDDIVDRLRRRAEQSPAGAIRGYGYDQSRLAERRHPGAADLDRVATDRQVQIQHASGHGYAVNSAVLRDAGITAGTVTPPGGRIDRDDTGNPTGVIFDSACDLLTGPDGVKVGNHGPNFHLPMSDDEVARLFDLGQQSFLAAGITTICDAQVTELEMAAYLRARDAGRLRMRAHLMYLSSTLDHLRSLGLVSRLGDERLELHGVKLYADGSVIARTAYLGDHACCGAPSPRGYLYHEPAELIELITTAHRLGLRTATHAQGELPIGLVLDAVEQARGELPRKGLRHRIEHCGFPTDEQIQRMARLDVVPVPQPMQVHLYGDSLMAEYGEYGGRFYPYGTFERTGVPVVVSSDAPVTMPGPLRAAWAAVTRSTVDGGVAGGAAQGASRSAALRGITSTPADLLDRHDLGTLRVGSRADLVLVDTDPVTAPIDALAYASVTETWVAGELAWSQQGGIQ